MQTNVINQEEYTTALKELEALHPTVILDLPTAEVSAIAGALQLALRHPGFPPTSGNVCRKFIQQFQEKLDNHPVMVSVIEIGFNPEFGIIERIEVNSPHARGR